MRLNFQAACTFIDCRSALLHKQRNLCWQSNWIRMRWANQNPTSTFINYWSNMMTLSKFSLLGIFVLSIILLPGLMQGQFAQQGNKLVATGTSFTQQGRSVALSNDFSVQGLHLEVGQTRVMPSLFLRTEIRFWWLDTQTAWIPELRHEVAAYGVNKKENLSGPEQETRPLRSCLSRWRWRTDSVTCIIIEAATRWRSLPFFVLEEWHLLFTMVMVEKTSLFNRPNKIFF